MYYCMACYMICLTTKSALFKQLFMCTKQNHLKYNVITADDIKIEHI